MSSQTTVYPVLSYVIVCEAALHNYSHPLNKKATQAKTVNSNNTGEQNANAKHNEGELSEQQESCDVISEHPLIAKLTPLYCASAPYGNVNMYEDSTLKDANNYTRQEHEENENICQCWDSKESETHMQCVINENAALRGVLEGFAGSVLSLKEHNNKTVSHNEQVQHWEHVYKEYATFTAEGEIKIERLLSPLAAEGVYIQVPSTEYIRRCHRQASDASSDERKHNNNTQHVITNPFQFANEFNEHHCTSHSSIVDENTKDGSSNSAEEHIKFSETSLDLPDMGYLYGYAFCPRGTQILCNKFNNNYSNNENGNAVSSTLMICILSHSPCFNFMRRCAMEAVNMIRGVYVLMCSDTLCSKESIEKSENNNNHKNSNNSCSISSSKRRSILANLIAEKLTFVESYVNVRSDVNTHILPGQILPVLQMENIRQTVTTTSPSTLPSSMSTFDHEHTTDNITHWCQVKQKLRKPLDVLYPYAEVPLPVLLSSFTFSAIRILQTLLFFSLDSSIYSSSNSKGNLSVNSSIKLFVIGTSAQHASACVVALPALLTPLSFCATIIPFMSPCVAVQSRFLEFMCYHDNNNNSCLVGSTPELIPHLQLLSNLPCSCNQDSCWQYITKGNNNNNINTSIWIADARTGFVGRVPLLSHSTNKESGSSESLSPRAMANTSAALAANNAISLQTCKLLPLMPYDGRLRRRIKRAINKKQLSSFRAAINLHTRQEERYDRCAQEIKEAKGRNKNIKEFAHYSSPTLSSSHPSSYQEYHLHSHKHHRKQAKATHVNTNVEHNESNKEFSKHHHHQNKYNVDLDNDQIVNKMKTYSSSYSSSSSSSSSLPKTESFSEDFISNNCNNSHSISSSASVSSSISSSSSSSSSASFSTSSDKESSGYDDKSLFTASVIDVIDMDEQETGQRPMSKMETLCLETQNKSELTGISQIGVTGRVNNNANMKIGRKVKCSNNNHNNNSSINNNNVEQWCSSLYSYTGCYCLEYVHGALLAANTRWLLGNYRLPLMVAGMNVEKSLEEYICQHNMLPLLRAMTNKNNVPSTLLNVIGTSYAVFVFFQALAEAEKTKLSVFLQNVTFSSTGANLNNSSKHNIYLSHPSFRSLLQLFFVHACRCFPSLFAEIAHINGVLQCEQITQRVLTLHQHVQKQHGQNTSKYGKGKNSNSYSVEKCSTSSMCGTSTLMTLTLSAMALGKVKHNKKSITTNNNTISGNDRQQVSISTATTTVTGDEHSNKLNRKVNVADNYNYSVKEGKQKKKGVKGFFAAAKKMVKSTFATGKNGEGNTMYCNSKKNQKAYAAVIENFLQLRTSSRTLPFVQNDWRRQYTLDEVERKAEERLQRIKCNSITLADLVASSKQNTQVSYPANTAVTSEKYKNSKLQVNLLPLDVTYQFADYHPLLTPVSTNACNAKDKNEHWHETLFLSLCFNLPHNANMWHCANNIFTSQIINATETTTMRTEDNTFSNDTDKLSKRREQEERNVENDEQWEDLIKLDKIRANDCIINKITTTTNKNADVSIEKQNVHLANEKVTSKDNASHAITLDDLFAPITKIDNTYAHNTDRNEIYNNNDQVEPNVFTSEVSNTHASSPIIHEHQTLVSSSPNDFANITNTQKEPFSTLAEWGNFTSGAPDEYVAETPPLMWSANTLTPICNNNENSSKNNNNFAQQDLQHFPITPSVSFQSTPMIAPQSNQQQKQHQSQSEVANGIDLLDELFGSTSEVSTSK